MEKIENTGKMINFCVLGITGHGKSSVLNLALNIIGPQGKIFKESDEAESETSVPQRVPLDNIIQLWDFPGIFDTYGRDGQIITDILKYFDSVGMNGVALVHNASSIKMKEDEVKLIQLICRMFPSPEVWKHFIIIFTHIDKPLTKKNMMNKGAKVYIDSVMKVIEKSFSDIRNYIETIPFFLVCSQRNDDSENGPYELDSYREMCKAIAMICKFPIIEKEKVAKKIIVKTEIKKGFEEEEIVLINEPDKEFLAKVGRGALRFGGGVISVSGDILAKALGFGLFFGGLVYLTVLTGGVGALAAPVVNEVIKGTEKAIDDLHMVEKFDDFICENTFRIKKKEIYKVTYDLETSYYSDGTIRNDRLNEKKVLKKVEEY